MNNIIVGMGEALWDVLPEGKKIGGAPANFAYHVSQFGFDSRVVSAIGDDKLGNEILENFDGKNLNYLIEKVPYPTGTVQVELDPNGVPMYDIKEGVAWDNIPFTPALEELAKNTRSVCFGSLAQRSVVSRETINRFLDVMPDGEGQCKIFDVNLRQGFYTKEILCNSMKKCNILKINDEELVTVSRMFGYPGIDLQDKCWILLAKYNLKMTLPNGKTLEIKAPGVSDKKRYVQSLKLNGKVYDKMYITHEDILKGGVLEFKMGASPNKRRGLSPEDKPYSLTNGINK